MYNYARENTSAIRCREKKKKRKMKPVHHFQVHNPVKLFALLMLITCFNVSNNLNASNILSEFLCSLMKISHGFTSNKTKNHGSCMVTTN